MKKLLFLVSVVLLSAGLVVFSGCEDDEPQTVGERIDEGIEELGEGIEEAGEEIQEEAEDTAEEIQESTDDAQSNAAVRQEVCPVMGGKINPELYVEYQGEKVYFCCAGCPEEFQKNPEQYLAKLPQFQN